MAKGLANSLPLACLIGRSDIINSVPAGVIGGTFQGNSLSMAVSKEVLKTIREEDILSNVKNQSNVIDNYLLQLWKNNTRVIADIRVHGLMIAIEFTSQKITDNIFDLYLKNNIIVMKTSYPNTLRIIPPLNIKDDEVNLFISITQKIVSTYRDV